MLLAVWMVPVHLVPDYPVIYIYTALAGTMVSDIVDSEASSAIEARLSPKQSR